ncbi:MAG: Na+/H+ antiporter subunit E [Rhodobacteraceae bacterium]|nr:Na+/H+ antiporter subunit E [Paracoccaceae bacterium]
MSGIYKPMIIGFGAAASVLAVYVSRRMDQADGDKVPLLLSPLKLLGYLGWLTVEIAKSNISVTRTILSRKMPIRQNLFRVPSCQWSELGQVIFANSITLTPGTITVETEDDDFWVHAVSFSNGDHAALADMGARVGAVETGGAN